MLEPGRCAGVGATAVSHCFAAQSPRGGGNRREYASQQTLGRQSGQRVQPNLTLLGEHRWSVLTSAWIECLIGSDDRLSSSVPYISCGIDRSDPPGILKFLLVYSRYKTVPTNLTICRQKHKYSNPPLSKLVL